MMARVITVESLVLVKEITFSDEAAINIAILQVDRILAFVLDVADLLARFLAERAMENKKLAVTENDAASQESCMSPWLVVQDARHLQIILLAMISTKELGYILL